MQEPIVPWHMSPVLRAIMGRNEPFWLTLDVGNLFGPTIGFKISKKIYLSHKTTQKICSPPDLYLPTKNCFLAPPYTFREQLTQNLLGDQFWAPMI